MNGQDLSETQKITQGYVQYHDGQKMDGFIKRFHTTSSRITFRKTKKGSNNNIKSKKLSEIGLFHDGDTLIFHRHALGRYFNNGKKFERTGHSWATQIYSSSHLSIHLYKKKSSHMIGPSDIIPVPIFFNDKKMNYAVRFGDEDVLISLGEANTAKNREIIKENLYDVLRQECVDYRYTLRYYDNDEPLNEIIDMVTTYETICH